MALNMEVLTVRVASDTAKKFRELCDARGIKLSMVMRGAVEEFVCSGDVPLSADLTPMRGINKPKRTEDAATVTV